MWFVQPVDGETSQDKKSAGWGQGLGQEGKRVWPFLWLLEQWGMGARGVSLSSLPVAHHSIARHLPATLTSGLVELQRAFAGQSNFGPGLGRTGCAGYNQTELVPFWILSLTTWAGLGTLFNLPELGCLT